MRRFSLNLVVVVLAIGATLVGGKPLDAQPGGGAGASVWSINDPKKNDEIANTSGVAAAGDAKDASHAYNVKVTKTDLTLLNAASGTSTSSTPSTWSKTVSPPAGGGNKWPNGTHLVNLYVDGVRKGYVFIKFVDP